jgi:peptide/nickel transport system permease protein
MVVISLIGRGMPPLIISIGVLAGISESRVIRSAVMKLKEDMYIQAAKAIGCSSTKIIIRHILPHIMAPLIILFSTRVPLVILIEATLSFLGFGIPPRNLVGEVC